MRRAYTEGEGRAVFSSHPLTSAEDFGREGTVAGGADGGVDGADVNQ